jgi:hypothetical protein
MQADFVGLGPEPGLREFPLKQLISAASEKRLLFRLDS